MLGFVLAFHWTVTILLAIAVVVLAQQIGILHARLGPMGARMIAEGPDIGEILPATSARTVQGGQVVFGGSRPTRQLVVFLSSGCSACNRLVSPLRRFAADQSGTVTVVVAFMSELEPAEVRTKLEAWRLGSVPTVLAPEIPERLLPEGTPFAVMLDESGAVTGKGIANTYEHLESLLAPAQVREAVHVEAHE